MSNGIFFTTELPPYRFGVIVSVGQTRQQLSEDLKKVDRKFKTKARASILSSLDSVSEISTGCVISIGDNDAIMWLRDMPETNATCGVLIHEAVHLATFCLVGRGMKMGKSGSSQEPYCYLIEHIWNEVMAHVSRARK